MGKDLDKVIKQRKSSGSPENTDKVLWLLLIFLHTELHKYVDFSTDLQC
jgi:hypothetical protein